MKVKVKIKDFSKIYQNNDGVKGINLNIYENEILTLLGPSGCGKTTILRGLGGFVKPTSGSIIIDDLDVTKLAPEDRPTGMVFQSYNLWPHMTVYDNLAFGLRIRKIPKAEITHQIKNILDMVRLPNMEKKYPAQLSGGQQQRVAIARSLLLQPEVLLLDEPFSALDAKIRLEMREELKRIKRELNLTVVFVTHDQEEAMMISDRIVVMDKGKIAQSGSPEEVYDQPASHYVASFIGAMNFVNYQGKERAIRPEDIFVSKDLIYDQRGQIINKMILGHYVELTIQDGNNVLKAYVQRLNADEIQEGSTISYTVGKFKVFE